MSLKDKKTEKNRTGKKSSVSITEEVNRKVYRYVRDGAVGEYLSGYDKTCELYQNTWFYHKWSCLKKKLSSRENEVPLQEKKPDDMEDVGIYDEKITAG